MILPPVETKSIGIDDPGMLAIARLINAFS